MSGGSFNYLYLAADVGNLGDKRGDLRDMANALRDYGDADAADATLAVIEKLDAADEAARQLQDVWHAFEYWQSSDRGPDSVVKALAEWRGRVGLAPRVPCDHERVTLRCYHSVMRRAWIWECPRCGEKGETTLAPVAP